MTYSTQNYNKKRNIAFNNKIKCLLKVLVYFQENKISVIFEIMKILGHF